MTNSNNIQAPDTGATTVRPSRNLLFMICMAVAVGSVAGLGAWAFRLLIGLIHNALFLGQVNATYDANVFTPASPWGIGVVLVPVAGALVVAWLVKNFAPEAKGHGVPEVMDAIYYNEGKIRPRVALVKSLASAISIGSGGSVGREGPIVQIGSAFGSTLGALFPMSISDRVTLIAAGAGAGIAATFNAPLGGMVFAIELLLVSVNARNIMLLTTATVVATQISHYLLGTLPSFYIPSLEVPDFHLLSNWGLPMFAVLGALIGLLSVAFIRGLYAMEDVFDALPGDYYFHHCLGMLCVGIMMYLMLQYSGQYYVEGVGYATIMAILQGALSDPWFLILLTALKLLATCLSLGSGASGGVFSPALFMGATGGAAFGHLCVAIFPGLDIAIAVFAIAGMAAAVAGSTGAVLTAIVMLTEMTLDSSITMGLAIACAASYVVRKSIMQDSIYSMKLRARGHTVPEGLHSAVLTSQRLEDMMSTDFSIVDGNGVDTAAVTVRTQSGKITAVSMQSPALAGAGSTHEPVEYVHLSQQTTPLAAVSELWNSQVRLVLVSRNPQLQRAQDIVGIVDADMLARVLNVDKSLS
ncbi:H(+)/Cl(-) exchange transporter ClcA [Halioglobus japonicus]|nr:H(+)/Cl(-) exchange transporter ClcA [Halioglobus japonicus]